MEYIYGWYELSFIMNVMLYKVSQFCASVINFIVDRILAYMYDGKGKTVSPVKNPLLLKSATKLARDIRRGKIKSVDAVKAYIVRILEVNPLVNATAECCFDDALNQARAVDLIVSSRKYSPELLAEEKPLLGVPITIKVLIGVKGLKHTAASKLFEDVVAEEDAPIVKQLRDAGAIVLTTTNAPEMGLSMETRNKLYGVACNPFDTNRTSGGSSGGESALISAGGSVLGIGNDIAGSLRIPAHFTGIFAHMPTRGLVPNEGSLPPKRLDPSDTRKPPLYKFLLAGPMCRYAEDLVTSMKVLSTHDEVRTRFGQQVDFSKLKVYYLTQMQSPFMVPLEKEIKIALKKAVTHFKKHYNVPCKELKMSSLYDAGRCVVNRFLVLVEDVNDTLTCGRGLPFSEKLDFLKFLFGKSTLSFMTLLVMNIARFPIWCRKDQNTYFEKIEDQWIKEFDSLLDEDTVLLMPTLPFPAPYHCGMIPKLTVICYTGIFNVLGLPVTQCPLGFNKEGLPYGIQIVGGKNNDPLTIACAVELEKAFGGWKSPSRK
ncbi:hypothetical protein CDAR_482801 [Caerostris darwini]|uniref:Amidase domain-containing protein n=1 Tax=Caerostris darwini TaxID=1538125 RepID=A0AAV4WAB7_9ARAC|nr:hypothetical protein CDAR_482801 [Caerostris darwini]